MKESKFEFNYTVYESINELPDEDQWLLNEAREVTEQAYAPYSNFQVGAIAKLANGEIVAGSNQENASFPVGLCTLPSCNWQRSISCRIFGRALEKEMVVRT